MTDANMSTEPTTGKPHIGESESGPALGAYELPKALRDIAERNISHMKDACEKMRAATDEAADIVQDAYATVAQGYVDFGVKVIDMGRTNASAAFEFANELFAVRSPSDVIGVTAARVKKHLSLLSEQTDDLAVFAWKIAVKTAEPIQGAMNKSLKTAA